MRNDLAGESDVDGHEDVLSKTSGPNRDSPAATLHLHSQIIMAAAATALRTGMAFQLPGATATGLLLTMWQDGIARG